jgi:hypothetical protein
MTPKRIPIFCGHVLSTAGFGFLILALALTGCSRPQSAAHASPPPAVTVSNPVQKEVVNWSEFTGRTAAVNFVNVTARVNGYIVSIPFKEGDIVHKGISCTRSTRAPKPVDDNGIVAWVAESPLKAAGNRIKGRVRKSPIHKADFSYN